MRKIKFLDNVQRAPRIIIWRITLHHFESARSKHFSKVEKKVNPKWFRNPMILESIQK